MGREIRRVKAGWEHPQKTEYNPYNRKQETFYQPMYDRDYETAAAEWKKEFYEWENGERARLTAEYGEDYGEYWDYSGNPPDKEYYRPKWAPEEMTHFAVYETVSEGTPVTPAFATKEELVDYLVNNGDFWDQRRGDGGWLRENAERFVETGFAMSMVVIQTEAGAEIKAPRDGQFN